VRLASRGPLVEALDRIREAGATPVLRACHKCASDEATQVSGISFHGDLRCRFPNGRTGSRIREMLMLADAEPRLHKIGLKDSA
jgi:hypothetical protein